ncbi:MAG: T9SS type A sorting domain-containing protein [Gemmatimonadetes bacterium]|nr:T9SS type A sorting domain-containing protein [Gemmatimonadota bacterium]
MFLKKSLLFMTALALLMFAGQASAQSVSLSHVPGEDGTEGMVSGSGTAIMVKVTTMGIAGNPLLASVSALDVSFAFDPSLVKLTGVPAGLLMADAATGATLTIPAPPGGTLTVPEEAILTFTTQSDVTGMEFSIGITGAQGTAVVGGAVQMVPLPISAMVAFNEIDLTISLMSGGESVVNKVSAGDEIVVDVAIPTLMGQIAGAKIVFAVDPAGSAGITGGMPAEGLNIVPTETSGMQVVVAGLPMMLADGNFGSVTFTAGPGVTRTTGFSISVASMSVFTTAGEVAGDPGDPLMINQFSPFLEASATEVTVPHGETAMATVTAMDTGDEAVTFTVAADGVESSEDGNTVTLSATGNGTATVSAMAGGVALDPVTVVFSKPPPELQTESTEVTFADFGAEASASVMAVGFDEGAEIKYTYTATTDFQAVEDASGLMITTASAGTVTVTATDGTDSASLTITFMNPDPYLSSDPDPADVIIPEGGEASVTVSATGLEGAVTYMISRTSGTATVTANTDGDMVTLTASGEGGADVMVTASAGGMTTEAIAVKFRAMPTVGSDATDVMVPQAVVPSAMAMVVATGFPEGAEIVFNVDPADHPYLTASADGNVLTLTATGTVSVSVTASGAGVTTSAVEVSFEQALPAAPASVVVQDQEGDNGHYVMVSFANSANHADVSQYRIYREMMVNTTMDADGNVVTTDTPMAKWVPWAVVDAMDNDDEEGMTRAVVPTTDAMATRWGVAAEKGMDSAEITPAGKRVFSKESVQQLAQFLGLDPNLVVTEDELAEMFMPSADYINALVGGRNVVFAALDPDLSVLIGGNAAVPQNIRTGGHPIVSSPITPTEGMVAAIDDTAPAMVTDVAADAETGVVTWTMSADDGGMDVVMYRGHGITIPHVTGYLVRGGVSEDAMLDIGIVPAGLSTFQVPAQLIESLINQGVPAVLVTVTAMDGTNMTPSIPLVVELIPTRKPFVDADGGPVYIVKLDRHGAMTPLTVDFEDFVAFTMAFNTDETHENWRVFVQADLNDDKMVNFEDFILFFGSYGKEAAGPAGKSLVTPILGVNENAEFSLRLGSDRVVVGENMFVDVSLANVQALMGYGFVLNYDAERFEFVEAMPAAEDLLTAGGETPLFSSWSPEAGQVHVMNAIVNGSEVSGGGDIVRLVFRVLRDFEDNARFEIAEGLVFDPQQLANPLAGGVLDIQTTPTEFALLQNFPNPFNPDTTIGYELAESADVTLQIYNVVGQVVRTLIAAESQSIGRYQVRWDGMDDRGMPVSSGIYFYQISAGKFQDVRKLMLLK